MITKIGELIERVTTSVKQLGINPHSQVIVRMGDKGPPLQIEHVKVTDTIQGRVIILQVKEP